MDNCIFSARDAAGTTVELRWTRGTREKLDGGAWVQLEPGVKYLVDADGQPVAYVGPGVFETADGRRLTSDCPHAP